MSDAEIATREGGLSIQFARAGDRHSHQILVAGQVLAASVEGGGEDDWPPSPPLQQLSIEDLGNGPVGLLVGMAIVGQTLYAKVLDRLSEFGTLKALGADEWQIHVMLLAQALTLAVVGCLMGLASVLVIHRLYSTPVAPIVIPWWLALGSSLLVLLICLLSSVLPYLRIRKVDPMTVLQS